MTLDMSEKTMEIAKIELLRDSICSGGGGNYLIVSAH